MLVFKTRQAWVCLLILVVCSFSVAPVTEEPSEITRMEVVFGLESARAAESPVSVNGGVTERIRHSLFHSFYRDDVTVRSTLDYPSDELQRFVLAASLVAVTTGDVLDRREISPVAQVTTITLGMHTMDPGRYVVRMRLDREGVPVHRQNLEFSHSRDRPLESLAVHPRDDRTLIVGGEPFFPIGLYQTPRSQGVIDDLLAAGFNTVRVSERSVEAIQMILDRLQSSGLKAWVVLGEDLDFSRDEAERKRWIRELVRAVGTHPALLMWQSIDEPAWGAGDVEGLVRGYEFLKELDPHHPVWINHAPRNDIATLAEYNRAADIVGCDIYPVPEPTGHTDLPNRTLSVVGDETDKNRSAVNDEKTVIMVLQGFAWGALEPGGDGPLVYPTIREQRYMAYNAVLHGAKGLLYWGSNHTPKPSQAWADIKAVASELGSLRHVLEAPPSKMRTQIRSDTGGVEAVLRFVDGETYLVCVNNEDRPARATVSGLPHAVTELHVLYEPEGRLAVRAGSTDVDLPGYGVLVASSSDALDHSRPAFAVASGRRNAVSDEEPTGDEATGETTTGRERNLVRNASFELASVVTGLPEYWKQRYPLSSDLSSRRPHSGVRCIELVSRDETFKPLVIQRGVHVEPGVEYELRAWLRTEGGGIEGRIYAEWVADGDFHTRATQWSSSHAWRQIGRRFRVPEPSPETLYITLQTRGVGRACFDDVLLTRVR